MKLPTELKTKSGHRIIGVKYEEYNSLGNKVTFPIKGSIVLREKPRKLKYCIWRKDGRENIFQETDFDIDF
jgi:hypothetical protein